MFWMPKIYLKSTINENDSNHSPLVHETAHILHFLKDLYGGNYLSEKWHGLFPNDRKGRQINDPEFLEESGVLNPYSAINYHVEKGLPINFPQGNPNASFDYNDLKIDIFGNWDFKKVADYLFHETHQLPGKLKYTASHIVIAPNLGVIGACLPDTRLKSPLNGVVTEDIATHTSLFNATHKIPERYPWVVEKVNRNPLTRKRLEVLVEEDFLDEENLGLIR